MSRSCLLVMKLEFRWQIFLRDGKTAAFVQIHHILLDYVTLSHYGRRHALWGTISAFGYIGNLVQTATCLIIKITGSSLK